MEYVKNRFIEDFSELVDQDYISSNSLIPNIDAI